MGRGDSTAHNLKVAKAELAGLLLSITEIERRLIKDNLTNGLAFVKANKQKLVDMDRERKSLERKILKLEKEL